MAWRFSRITSAILRTLLFLTVFDLHLHLSRASQVKPFTSLNDHSYPQLLQQQSLTPKLRSTHEASHPSLPGNRPQGGGASLATPVPADPLQERETTLPRTKREQPSWRTLQGAWGKREDYKAAPGWGSFRGAWGKKADWSSLRGAWGKRGDLSGYSRSGWTGLHGAWGKREDLGEDLQHLQEYLPNLQDDPSEDLKKRAGWSSLQGSWGKRTPEDKRAGWSSLQGSWGKRSGSDDEFDPRISALPGHEEEQLTEAAVLKDLAATLSQSASHQDLDSPPVDPPHGSPDLYDSDAPPEERQEQSGEAYEEGGEEHTLAKRGKSGPVSGVWLKRPDGRLMMAPRSVNWSSLRGSWGKRGSPNNWSHLRGTWGKRDRPEKWSHLRGSWGKRGGEGSWSHMRGSWGKRAPSDTNWGKFRGAWGKRGEVAEDLTADAIATTLAQ